MMSGNNGSSKKKQKMAASDKTEILGVDKIGTFLLEQAHTSPLIDFLHPLDLLKLLHVNKAARRAAVPRLVQLQKLAGAQAKRFREWLQHPQQSLQAPGSRMSS